MPNELDLYGPPGTGKTYRLSQIAVESAARFGPQALGAVTYTRAAAIELRGRLAASLGIQVPDNTRAASRILEQSIPWVGTIHSLCYRMIGRPPLVSAEDLKTFARSVDPHTHAAFDLVRRVDDLEGYEYADVGSQDEIELALQMHAMARHRMVSLEEASRFLTDRARLEMNAERIVRIVKRYEQFKKDTAKIDFEDMLEAGREIPLPVTVLLCDEVQDNSALLWSVINSWQLNSGLTVMAGDPWQAIYQYSGAAPELFRRREGKWITIGNSRRLSAMTAKFALTILRQAGYAEDSLLSTWQGVGGQPKDGTSFYLARTNGLLREVRQSLEDRGVPYRLLRGTGPLQTNAAKAYRAWSKERGSDTLTAGTAHLIAMSLPTSVARLPHGMKASLERQSAENPDFNLNELDRKIVEDVIEYIPHFDYFQRIEREYGAAGFVLDPTTAVGTIHASKGREADRVHVVRSWGVLPGRNMLSGGRKEEACVAYVATTRHRSSLSFIESAYGIAYPFPALPRFEVVEEQPA